MTEDTSMPSTASETEWKAKRVRLLRLFVFLAFFCPLLFYCVNWFFYPPNNPTLRGTLMVFAGYMGTTLGALIWVFLPSWIYRIIIHAFKKNYDRAYDLILLIGGGIFAGFGMYGSAMN